MINCPACKVPLDREAPLGPTPPRGFWYCLCMGCGAVYRDDGHGKARRMLTRAECVALRTDPQAERIQETQSAVTKFMVG